MIFFAGAFPFLLETKTMPNSLRRVGRALALVLFVCASANVTTFAQGRRAYKIDETDYLRCDLGEVAQVTFGDVPLFAALKEHPDARAAVVVHGPQAGDAMRYARQVRLHLVERRGVLPGRVLDVYGGYAGKPRLEIWLVPAGAEPPRAAPPVSRVGVTLFDRYYYYPGEVCPEECDTALEVFAETLKQLADWRGTVVVRPHANPRGKKARSEDWDPEALTRRQALRRAAEERLRLVRQLGLDPSRIRAVVGAPAGWAHAELWLVPHAPGAKAGGR